MLQLLKPKQQVTLQLSGAACHVEEFLGSGGQGEVYRATISAKPVALKWYYPHCATPEQKTTLERIIHQGAPTSRFLWPLDLAFASKTSPISNFPGFGYIMPLRDARYKNIVDLLKRRLEPSFQTLIIACRELAHNYLQLHASGFCYRDISFGNVFFDPTNGEILICDNDNVAINGQPIKSSVLGTPKFMAPEIVRGQAVPSIQTDLYSLAVLMFYMLMLHHPLDGKRVLGIRCMDLPAMNKLYGSEPLFIYDPHDPANQPDPSEQENAVVFWNLYPQILRKLFTRAFTQGLFDPALRVRESEWRAAMQSLLDSIFYCPTCSMETFYDSEEWHNDDKTHNCWACNNILHPPPRLHLEKTTVLLNHNTKLFPHHVNPARQYDFSVPVAEVSRHPTDRQIWGLKNLTKEDWTITALDGSVKKVPAGRSVTLAAGIKIAFGNTQGEIRTS